MLIKRTLMATPQYIIVVAGGRGTRMGGNLPKQFLPLVNSTVLMHTLDRMAVAMPQAQLILALPHDQQEEWQRLCNEYGYNRPHKIVDGGETRFHTVSNALALVPEGAVVAIHDGVRPLVSVEVVRNAFTTAQQCGSAIPVMPVVESLRIVNADTSQAVERSAYRSVQTPQVFDSTLLKAAYATPYCDSFTDDASVYEHAGHKVALIDGNRENIKITIPQDIALAEILLTQP